MAEMRGSAAGRRTPAELEGVPAPLKHPLADYGTVHLNCGRVDRLGECKIVSKCSAPRRKPAVTRGPFWPDDP